MISTNMQSPPTAPSTDRLLVVGSCFSQRDWIEQLRERYDDMTVTACDSYLAGIADVATTPARAVLACVDTSMAHNTNAIAGLTEAAGADTKVVLCCAPEAEPVARRLIEENPGAGEYVLHPIDGDDLDRALGYVRSEQIQRPSPVVEPMLASAELSQLGEALDAIDSPPTKLFQRVADLVRSALAAQGVTVVVEGATATVGEPVRRPVLTAPVRAGAETIGQLLIGPGLRGPYLPADVERLDHYAKLVAHVLSAASLHRKWHRLALTDECSGLPNRRYLHDRLSTILARAHVEQFPVTVLLFDVDNFKQYNDAHGHAVGDEIIRVTGELFKKACRDQDIVARYGGDEFAVVFWDPEGPRTPGSRHPDGALQVIDRFTEAMRLHRFPKISHSGPNNLTISGGLATYPWDETETHALIACADRALLEAKRTGKNRIIVVNSV